MIKRIVIFALLLVTGFMVLDLIIDPLQPRGSATGEPGEKPAQRRDGPSISVPAKDDKNSAVVVQPRGESRYGRRQRIAMPNGYRLLPVYTLHAKDSRPEPGNRLAMTGVTIDFFEHDLSDPSDPRAVNTATVTAGKALIELSRDENQVSQLAEDKLMEFWDVVYTSGSAGPMRDTTIRLGHAQAIDTADMIHLWTPAQSEPIRIESRGDPGFTVDGNGLDAWVPSSRNRKGEVELRNAGAREVTVIRNATLVHGTTTLSCRGPLHLKEDTRTGAVLATWREGVRIESLPDGAGKSGKPGRGGKPGERTGARRFVATGDALTAVLSAADTDRPDRSFWQRIDLRGTPAHLTDSSGMELRCARLTVLPDTSGAPLWITAAGVGEHAPVVTHVVSGVTNTYRCAGDVHVVQVARQHRFFLESYGLAGGIPTAFDQLVVFAGRAEVVAAKSDLRMVAAEGLTLLRSAIPGLEDSVILRGRGRVDVTSKRVRAHGTQGFLLQQWVDGDGTAAPIVRVFRLGPEQPDTGHRYDVHHLGRTAQQGSPAVSEFRLTGSGFCQIRLRGDAAEEVHLRSLTEDVDVRMAGTEPRRLWQVRTLDAWLQPDGRPSSLIARGEACKLDVQTKDGRVTGRAEEIHHPTSDTYRLVGNLAEVENRRYGRLRGRDILVQQLGAEDVRLRASQNASLVVTQLPQRRRGSRARTGRDGRFTVHAGEIRVEPMLLPPFVRAAYTALRPLHLDTDAGARHLFASGGVEFDYRIVDAGRTHTGSGAGDTLVARVDRAGRVFTDGRLTGAPARLDSLGPRDRQSHAESDRISFHIDAEGEFLTLDASPDRKPVLRLLGLSGSESGSGSGQPERLQLTSAGPIALGPRQIRCTAPVAVRSLDLRGAVDPDGHRLDARSATIARSEGGEITGLVARGDVDFRWLDARGTCEEFSIDIQQTLLVAKGIVEPAVITLPSGTSHLGQVEYNYRTKMARVWKGLLLTRR